MMKSRLFAALAALGLLALTAGVHAQTVSQQPLAIKAGAVSDLGNGPLKIRALSGGLGVFVSFGTGTSTTVSSSTSVTLNSTPSTTPCVGCVISGTGIPVASSVTVTAYNGSTGLTLSNQVTVATGVTLSWGVACPTTVGSQSQAAVRSGSGMQDTVLYTQARVCAAGNQGNGQFSTFPVTVN